MKNLLFFEKDGNSLNFTYNTELDRYEGDLIFHENSSDTFKTQAIYLFEKIPSFEFEFPPDLYLKKFQLFNEYGFHFYESRYATQSIDMVEPVNQEPDFYSKWIHGHNFEAKFKLGTMVRFNSSLFEFTDPNLLYCVVGSKKNAIMVLSTLDNQTFESSYSGSYGLTSSYVGKTISGVDVIGIYNYINPNFTSTDLSPWNEQNFYNRIYKNRKLNIVNSSRNDGIVTVKNEAIDDVIHYEYRCDSVPANSTLWMEVITRTDLPKIYQGPLVFSASGFLEFGSDIPTILKPGMEFKVTNSTLNTFFFTVSEIPTFVGNANLTYYATGSQVLWENNIYQCIQAYTWSGAMTSSITPASASYWGSPTYLPIDPLPVYESLGSGELYLTTDHLYFTQSYTQSSNVTLASLSERYKEDLDLLNIDLFYQDGSSMVHLQYPSEYAIVNFYHTQPGPTYAIGTSSRVYERAVETYEYIYREFNYDYSDNFSYNIVFTDIDEAGIIITINKMVYQEAISWVYSSGQVDMERTIDKTLRNWLSRNFIRLVSLGLLPTLQTIGYVSVYYNAINLKTEFPNVPIDFDVRVGTTADFYIENSSVIFYDMGKFLSISVNNREYGVSFDTDISTTLLNWVDRFGETLEDFGILVLNFGSSLRFNTRKRTQRIDLSINVGKSTSPGIDAFKIIKKWSGNHGTLITSNEILMATASVTASGTASFISSGFSTGMVSGINSTAHPLQDIEYNVVYLGPDRMNLSYEGPFWGSTTSICISSDFTIISFDVGFGQTACTPPFVPDLLRGMYSDIQFSNEYSSTYLLTSTYSLASYGSGVPGMVDIGYVPPSNSIYVFGEGISVFDSITADFIDSIDMVGLTQSLSLCYNPVTNYLFALSKSILYKIDPYINQVISTFSLAGSANSLAVNSLNGDVYVSFENINQISIYDESSTLTTILTAASQTTYDMAFNSFEGDMYVTTGDGSSVIRVDGSTRTIQTTYAIPGLTSSILYESENESMYVYGSSNLYKIDNGVVATVSSVTVGGSFNDMIYNNLSNSINISSDSSFDSVLIDTDALNYSSNIGGYGYQALNQFDGDIYVSDQTMGRVIVVDSIGGSGSAIVNTIVPVSGGVTTRLVYNPDRRSIWLIQPSAQNVIEVSVGINGFLSIETAGMTGSTDPFYGSLEPGYNRRDYLWLHSREYIRKPRENFYPGPTVSLYWRWFSDNVPEIFLYDFSGSQLPTSGSLAYTGPRPLTTTYLNKKSNRDPDKILLPEYQQTVFDRIDHELDFIDSVFDVSEVPEPLQTFVGFKSEDEGALRTILQLYKKEDVDFTITTTSTNEDIITFETIEDDQGRYGLISLDSLSTSYFTYNSLGSLRGLQEGQHLAVFIKDVTNSRKQYISPNNGFLVKIRKVFSRSIMVDFFKDVDEFQTEKTIISAFPKSNQTTYLSCRFKVWDKEIGRFNVLGQTEVEDIRYHVELNNVGKLVSSDDVYIFKEYDIKEEGIDWSYLNMKRKEMLMMRDLIYPYIGSYKSIINAINYFGYNDLELYEYYRNIDRKSRDYLKLFKVEIPDIFDNSVEGWTDNDFIKHTFPNPRYEDTNLFNLTYRITDREGNNVLMYTVEEVQKKLQGLKYWLQKNIIPITHKILDITGRADFVNSTFISHIVRDCRIIKVSQDFTPVTFKLNEAYLMPVNSGSTVYNCVLDFYVSDYATASLLPDYYTIDIKTYQIYREWHPFKTYFIGDRVIYYNKLYESVVDRNKTSNPRKYENAEDWIYGSSYNIGDVVKHNRLIYVYSGQDSGATFSYSSPVIDSGDWLDITDWREIDLVPIEKISEYRRISNRNPFNFTIDSNISPYLVIEVISENGYGMSYADKKNYEIRGILDLTELETYSNLTSKTTGVTDSPIISPRIDLILSSFTYKMGVENIYGHVTDRPYFDGVEIVLPGIQHAFPLMVTNASSVSANSFVIEMGDNFSTMINSYVISSTGSAYVSSGLLYWNGSLASGATVSVEVRAEVTTGGKADYRAPLNSLSNHSLVPLTYSVLATLKTGQRFGSTSSFTGGIPSYRYNLYSPTYSVSQYAAPLSIYDNFTSIFGVTNSIQYRISTFSAYGVNIIQSSASTLYGGGFATVSVGFNFDIREFGYVYYNLRRNYTQGSWSPVFGLSTYYTMSSTQSFIQRLDAGTLVETTSGSLIYDQLSIIPSAGYTYSIGGSTYSVDLVYYP